MKLMYSTFTTLGSARWMPIFLLLSFLGSLDVSAQAYCPALYPTNSSTPIKSIVEADFNGDGRPDLVTVHETVDGQNNTLSVLIGNGSGGFGGGGSYTLGEWRQRPGSTAVGDFNGDGKPDLVIANGRLNSTISVVLNNGSGGFLPPTDYAPMFHNTRVAVGDFNNDGKPDIVVLGEGGGGLKILLNNGSGGFSESPFLFLGSQASAGPSIDLTVGDFNKDGKLDVAVGVSFTNNNGVPVNRIQVLEGNGAGGLSIFSSLAYDVGGPAVSIAAGDVNGDGDLDLATVNAGVVSVLLGSASSYFGPKTDFAVGGNPNTVLIKDFNKDGKLDLVVANASGQSVSVLLGNGAGSFGAKTDIPLEIQIGENSTGISPLGLVVTDFNGDGKPDLATARSGTAQAFVMLNCPLSPLQANISESALKVCPGQVVNLSVTVRGGLPPYTYAWVATGATFNGAATEPTASATILDVKFLDLRTFRVTVRDAAGQTTTFASKQMFVYALPIATITATPSATLVCTQASLTLSVKFGYTYSFSGPGIVSTSGNTAVVNGPGIYSVTAEGLNGCVASSQITVDANNTGTPVALSINRKTPITALGGAAGVTYQVVFSDNVTGVDATDFTVTKTGTVTGNVGAVNGSGGTYTVDVTGITGAGTLRLNLNSTGTGIKDGCNNDIGGGYTSGQTYNIDAIPPTVTSITRNGVFNPASDWVSFIVTFSEPIEGAGINAADFTLVFDGVYGSSIEHVTDVTNRFNVDPSVSGINYLVEIRPNYGQGTLRLDVNATGTGITDRAGNPLSGGFTTGESFYIDRYAPMVYSIKRQAPASEVASPGSVTFRVTFYEAVTGVDVTDFKIVASGTVAGYSIGTITAVSTSVYDVTVNGITGEGTLQLQVYPGYSLSDLQYFRLEELRRISILTYGGFATIYDGVGNPLQQHETNGEQYTISNAPAVVSINRKTPGATLTNATSVVYTVTFSNAVSGVTVDDFTVALPTSGLTGLVTAVSASSGTSIDVTVSSITGNGELGLNLNGSGTGITDAAVNAISGGFTGQTYMIDQSPPTVASIVRKTPSAQLTNTTSVTYQVTFSESVTGVDATDFGLSSSGGTVTGTIGSVSGSGTTYDVQVNSIAGDGNLRLDENANDTGITDAASNGLVGGFTTGEAYTFDHTAPVVSTIKRQDPTDAATTATTLTYRVTFSEAVTAVDASDFVLTATGPSSGTINPGIATISASVYDVTVTVTTAGGGTLRLDLKSSGTGIIDAVTNALSSGFTTGEIYTLGIPPSISGCPITAQAFNSGLGICYATVTKATLLTGLTFGGAPTPTVAIWIGATEVTGSYNFAVGNTTVTVKAANGIGQNASCSFTVSVIDNIPPTITAPAAVSVNTNTACTATGVALGTPVTGDNCSVASVTNDAPTAFPLGATTVTWTVKDGSGNTSTATQMVTAGDNENPTITAPAAVSVSADAGVCTKAKANVTLGTPTTADNCSVKSVTNDAPPTFPLGITTVTYTVMDGSGNISTATQMVTVIDNQKPTITAPAAISLTTNTGCTRTGVALGTPITGDNCGVKSITNDHASTTYLLGQTTVTWTVTDNSNNTSIATQIITVTDNVSPTIKAPAAIVASTDAGSCSKTLAPASLGTPTVSDNCSIASVAGVRSDALALAAPYSFGVTTITWTATDGSGNTASGTQTVTINKILTTTTVTITPGTQQYSDLVTFKATVTPANCGTTSVGGIVTFKVGTQVMGSATVSGGSATLTTALVEPSPFGSLPTGQMSPQTGLPLGEKTVTADFSGYSGVDYTINSATTKLTLIREDARATFTGTSLVATQSSTSGVATVTLRATIQDITAVDPAGDGSAGDIRNAKVRFLNNNAPIIISGVTDANGWVLSSTTLVNSSDTKTGIVSANWPVNIGTATDEEYTIGIEVSGYYTRNSPLDNTVITVYKPVGDFITGGGHIVPTQSIGQYASDPGTQTNFGFHVKYNKSGTSLQGNMNILFRRTVNGVVRVYQVKSNAMSSLGVNIANPGAQTAVFVAKANLTDITNPLLPISLGGGLSLQANMTDKGEPGTSDAIAISLYNGSSLLYSSNWVSSKTVEMTLAGGNLVVHSGFSLGTTATAPPIVMQGAQMEQEVAPEVVEGLEVAAYPNPSTSQFTIVVKSSNTKDAITMKMFDREGRLLETRSNLYSGQSLQMGRSYRGGVYVVEITQNGKHSAVKLVKHAD